MERIGAILKALGADFDDVVKINNYYVGGGVFADWEAAARVRARYFTEPGPAATGMPVPRHAVAGVVARSEVTAMRGRDGARLPRRHVWPDGHWDWPIHMPYKHGIKCGDMIFVGGQVALTAAGEVIAPDDLIAQTRIAMANIGKVLAGFGGGLDDVVKVTSFYEGGASAETLHENLAIRSASFRDPGPATTGIPMPWLAYEGMVIEIEVIAMQER
jgi:enamine deaminase RidA (YjgF/YER057c/UK114 family)